MFGYSHGGETITETGQETYTSWSNNELKHNVVDSQALVSDLSLPAAFIELNRQAEVPPDCWLAYTLTCANNSGEIHVDPRWGSGWQFLVEGSKQWFMFNPEFFHQHQRVSSCDRSHLSSSRPKVFEQAITRLCTKKSGKGGGKSKKKKGGKQKQKQKQAEPEQGSQGPTGYVCCTCGKSGLDKTHFASSGNDKKQQCHLGYSFTDHTLCCVSCDESLSGSEDPAVRELIDILENSGLTLASGKTADSSSTHIGLTEGYQKEIKYDASVLVEKYAEQIYSVVIQPGDFVSCPCDWPHFVLTFDKSLGVSGYGPKKFNSLY